MMDKTNKTKASMYNMITAFLYQCVAAVCGFIVPALILNQYGVALHGYTTTVSNIMTYVALLNAGLAPAAVQALYKPLSTENKTEVNAVVNATARFYNKAGILYSIAIAFCCVLLPFVLSGQLDNVYIIGLMIATGAISTLECFVYSKYRVLMQADQHMYVVNLIDTMAYMLRVIIQIVLIKINANIIFVMSVPAFMVLFRMISLNIIVKKRYTFLDTKVAPDSSALNKRYNALVHQISSIVVLNTDSILLTIFGNLTLVSIYSVYNLVFSHLYSMMVNMFKNGTLASFGRVISSGDRKKLCETYDEYEFIYYFVVAIIYGLAGSLILPFVSIYTSNYSDVEYVSTTIAFLFLVVGVANNLRIPCDTLITAAGHFKETQFRSIFEAVINLSVSIILIKPLGIIGILIGTVCSYAYRTTDIIIYSHKHILNKSCRVGAVRILKTILTIALIIGTYNLMFNSNVVSSWWTWIIHAMLIGIISVLLSLIINFIVEPKQLKRMLTITKKILKK